MDGKVWVITSQDPGVVPINRQRLNSTSKFGVSRHVVGNLAHATREIIGGELSTTSPVGRDNVLNRGEPVRIENDDRVSLQTVQTLGT